jgi:Permuted papain-like amidase enzyme, YaeF/YiiX, C92 family
MVAYNVGIYIRKESMKDKRKQSRNLRIGLLCVLLFIGVVLYVTNGFGEPLHRIMYTNKEAAEVIHNEQLHNGDLIFHASLSMQSRAIQVATKSKYSHCGIIYKTGSQYVVLEAVQPVKATPLKNWIARGENGHYVVKRLKNADKILTPEVLAKMKREWDKLKGKNYDLTFEWSDDKIYCSELIWKIYKRATGLEIGKLQKLGDFDLSNPIVQLKMKERYGNKIPLTEKVISPGAIFESELLVTVKTN